MAKMVMNRAVGFYGTTIGKKQVMAVSGVLMVGFLLSHMSGHLIAFRGADAYNAYAAFLYSLGGLLWAARLGLLAAIVVHAHAAFSLWSLNNAARSQAYRQRKNQTTSAPALTMRYGGAFLLLFLVYHLAHFTFGVTERIDGIPFDSHNVYNNLVYSFQNPIIAGSYILAMGALGMHLYHGVWSFSQSLGLDHPKYNPLRRRIAALATLVITLGFVAMPVSVLLGVLQPE